MKLRVIKFIYLLIGAIIFSYIAIRAIRLGATFDEIMTIEGPVKLSFLGMFLKFSPLANNHLLNTFLIKVLFSLGNESLVIARLPNVLSFILYSYFGYKIALKTLSPLLGLGCFLLLLSNPFLLDFFSLARGYGLSLSFLMGALYFCSEQLKSPSPSTLSKSLLFASLSVISVLSMIYFWICLSVLLGVIPLLKKDLITFKKSFIYSTIIGAALLCITSIPTMRLIDAHALVYGGNTGFYSDTLLSLTRYSLYHFETTRATYLTLNSSLVLLALAILVSYAYKQEWISLKSLFLAILISPIFLIVLSHHLAGVLYPINRVALFIYPIFILCLSLFLNDLNRHWGASIILCLTAISSINFISNATTYKTALWSFESHTEEILKRVNKQGCQEGRVKALACTSILYQSIDYYTARNEYPFIRVIRSSESEIVPTEADCYILAAEDAAKISQEEFLSKWVRPLDSYEKDVVVAYPKENLFVFENLRKHS